MVIAILLTAGFCLSPGLPPIQKLVSVQEAGDAYTITTTVKIALPYDVRAMNDEFQSARLIAEADGVGTFEITYRPYHVQTVIADPNWRLNDAKMDEFVRPRAAANWNPDLKKTILADLAAEGIDPEKLDDKPLVEKVSAWALRRSKFNNQFGLWMVEFNEGKPRVREDLRASFVGQEPAGLSDQEIFDREVLGDGMYRNKTHGSCTSTSTYMATILRAVGIPTRIILTVPACDPNDRGQVKLLLDAIRHNQTRQKIRLAMSGGGGFTNHVFNEVWVGRKWVRLNYNRLGQPILDANYEGLMTHVFTTLDVSDVPFPSTWGARFALHAGPKLSSDNPYQLISARDDLPVGMGLINPPAVELTTATVTSIIGAGDSRLSDYTLPAGTDAVLQVKEWIKDQDYHQLRAFIQGAGRSFILRASGHPDVRAGISGFNMSDGSGTLQGFGVHLEGKLAPGVAYKLLPDNQGHEHSWTVLEGVVWRG